MGLIKMHSRWPYPGVDSSKIRCDWTQKERRTQWGRCSVLIGLSGNTVAWQTQSLPEVNLLTAWCHIRDLFPAFFPILCFYCVFFFFKYSNIHYSPPLLLFGWKQICIFSHASSIALRMGNVGRPTEIWWIAMTFLKTFTLSRVWSL